MATAVRLPQQLLRLAIPLVPSTGFTTQTLSSASLLLPSPHTAPAPGYSHHTLQSLFPSAPPAPRKRSLTREELLADAAGLPRREEERLGPAKALVEEWLEEGRRVMVGHLERGGWKGEVGVREGLRERVRWNENVVDRLPDALALLGASTASPLSSISALLPIPSPAPYLEHVARIAHDLSKASGGEGQGVEWYKARARIGTIYGMAELHLMSSSLASLSPADRTTSTLELIDRLLENSNVVSKKMEDAEQFGTFVVRSWMGIGRSLGL